MIVLILDAIILVFLLNVVVDEEMSMLAAIGVSLVMALITTLLVSVLYYALGVVGALIALALAATALGLIVSAIFGTDIQRSFLIAGLFVSMHLACDWAARAMFAA